MNAKDKKILLKELRKYEGDEPVILNGNGKIPLYNMLYFEKMMKKILIKNEYGVLGNLLYKYRNELDDEILINLFLADRDHGFCSSYSRNNSIFYGLPEKFQNLLINNRKFLLTFLSVGLVPRITPPPEPPSEVPNTSISVM